MLKFLSIRNFVIVDRMELEFAPGFTVLTGETGAGKSILIDALSLVLGERSETSVVRNGCDRAEISAEFDIGGLPELADWLRENGFENQDDDRDVCLLRRLVDAGGRSRSFINGRAATLQQLHTVGEHLVDIQGQHAHQSIVAQEAQRELLDALFRQSAIGAVCRRGLSALARVHRLRLSWEQNAAAFDQEREQLEWQASEISALNFSLDEWQVLQTEHSRLSHAALAGSDADGVGGSVRRRLSLACANQLSYFTSA